MLITRGLRQQLRPMIRLDAPGYAATPGDSSLGARQANQAIIQRAMRDAAGQGRELYIPPQRYYYLSTLTAFHDLRIVGEGDASELFVTDGSATPAGGILLTSLRRNRWRGFKLSSDATARGGGTDGHSGYVINGGSDHVMEYVTCEGQAGTGRYTKGGATRIQHTGCVSRLTGADGFLHSGIVIYATLTDCLSDQTGDDGASVVSYAGDNGYCEYISWYRHMVTNQGNAKSNTGRGLAVGGGKHILFEDCETHDSRAFGLYVFPERIAAGQGYDCLQTDDVVFRRCKSVRAGRAGVATPDGALIRGNAGTVASGPLAGDDFLNHNTKLYDCIIDSPWRHGILRDYADCPGFEHINTTFIDIPGEDESVIEGP